VLIAYRLIFVKDMLRDAGFLILDVLRTSITIMSVEAAMANKP
jgi:hypothetical protein